MICLKDVAITKDTEDYIFKNSSIEMQPREKKSIHVPRWFSSR